MLIQKEFLLKLKDFGLNSYESKIWTALLSLGMSTAGELSDIANVPRSRSYDVLESLVKKGFIILKPGKPITYIAIPPEEAVERMKNRVKKEAEVDLKIIEDLKSHKIIEDLKNLHSEGISTVDPTDLSGSISGKENIENHLSSMFRSAKKSITIYSTNLNSNRFLPLLEKAKKNAVKINIALNSKIEKNLSTIAQTFKAKERARYFIVDNRDVMFMLLDNEDIHPSYDTAIWVNSPFFASVLESMFKNAVKK